MMYPSQITLSRARIVISLASNNPNDFTVSAREVREAREVLDLERLRLEREAVEAGTCKACRQVGRKLSEAKLCGLCEGIKREIQAV